MFIYTPMSLLVFLPLALLPYTASAAAWLAATGAAYALALRALLPPRAHKRGLVLMDPPYEVPAEFGRLVEGLRAGVARFGTGVFAAWYPIKHRAPVRAFHDAVRAAGLRDVVCAEMWLREPTDSARLNGCGLLVRNPPWPFEQEAAPILSALLDRLGGREPGEGTATLRLTDE